MARGVFSYGGDLFACPYKSVPRFKFGRIYPGGIRYIFVIGENDMGIAEAQVENFALRSLGRIGHFVHRVRPDEIVVIGILLVDILRIIHELLAV